MLKGANVATKGRSDSKDKTPTRIAPLPMTQPQLVEQQLHSLFKLQLCASSRHIVPGQTGTSWAWQ